MSTTRKTLHLAWLALVVVASSTATLAQTPSPSPPAAEPVREAVAYKREPGPYASASFAEDWRDEKRERPVPVRIWHPESGDGPFPVIVFSHGLGGTRDGYAYLGKHWSSHGYVCVHVQHLGSDDGVWRDNPRALEAMQKAVSDPDNLVDRPADVRFAIDELWSRNAREDWKLAKKLDLARVGVAGHSFGAYTALCAAGRDLIGPLGAKTEVSDARVKACIAMSPQGNEREKANGSWREFATPVFHMTGTRDESPIRGDSKPEERRIPFDTIDVAEQYLLIFEGGTHMAFSDSAFGAGRRDPDHWPLILSSSTAFFDAHLRGDAAALAWLRDGGFAALLGAEGTFEHKSPAAAAAK